MEGNGCSIGPNPVDTTKASAGKTIALFALPGAFTPTCSAQHVPGYVEQFEALKAAGVDEIWCLSVNDAFVMGAWARDQKTGAKVRMLADGDAAFAKATGLTLDLTGKGLGLAQQPLLDAGQGWCGHDLEHRRPRQVRGERCRHHAGTGQGLTGSCGGACSRRILGPAKSAAQRRCFFLT